MRTRLAAIYTNAIQDLKKYDKEKGLSAIRIVILKLKSVSTAQRRPLIKRVSLKTWWSQQKLTINSLQSIGHKNHL